MINKTRKEVGDAFIRFMEREMGVSFIDVTPTNDHDHICRTCEASKICYDLKCKMPRDKYIICDTCWKDKSTLRAKIAAAKERMQSKS
jgi:hypothetical protein